MVITARFGKSSRPPQLFKMKHQLLLCLRIKLQKATETDGGGDSSNDCERDPFRAT